LAAQVARLGIGDRVLFEPQVESVQMPGQYHRIDVLVLPSLTRPNWKEQFGRVLVEAMMSGVPVIGSDSAAIPGVIGDAGLIVPEGDVASLAHALTRLRNDPRLRADLAARGRARALTYFSSGQVAAETLRVYESMLH
jgi:glycosyltransferase involved in cell wall biosynthesis